MRELGNGASSDMLRRGCEANVADGLMNSSVQHLSRLGHSGAHRGNLHRDLRRYMKAHGIEGINQYALELPVQRLGGVGIQWVEVPVLLPFDTIGYLYQNASLDDFRERMLGAGDVAGLHEFWRRAHGEEWFEHHPAKDEIEGSPGWFIPCRLYGDDAPVNNRSGIHVLTVCSAQCRLGPWLSRWLFAVLREDILVPDLSLNVVFKVLKWAFSAMRTGRYPACDHRGRPWPVESTRAAQAGTCFAGGLCFVYVQSIGDMKWEKETFKFEANYSMDDMCHRCTASKKDGPCCYTDFRADAAWTLHPRTHDEYMRGPGAGNPLCQIDGFHLTTVLPDMMHIVALGTLQVTVASTLRELCESGQWEANVLGGWRGSLACS